MSKITPDCIMCHERPAADRFGWCDHCATLYDEPAEPTAEDLAESQALFQAAVLLDILRAQTAATFPATRSAR